MKFLIETLKFQPAKDTKDPYYTFWVRFMSSGAGYFCTVSGWRYWPGSDKLSTPNTSHGVGKRVNLAYVDTETFNAIQAAVRSIVTPVEEVA
jgi:hypothetical protein